jgi:hypothetical protein
MAIDQNAIVNFFERAPEFSLCAHGINLPNVMLVTMTLDNSSICVSPELSSCKQ